MPPELTTFFIAMSPIVKLRGSIPIAIGIYKLPIWSAYLFSVLGNLLPLLLIVWLAEPVSRFFSHRFYFLNRLLNWILGHTRNAHHQKVARWGKELSVFILTATPIPFIGGWTGAIAAFVFGVPAKRATVLVILGALTAGLIVTALTLLAIGR
jgi:uncharacterized membrane protein